MFFVQMGEDSEVFVKVALFHGMEYHNILRNRPIAIKKRDIGMTESWIQDKDIIDQGFLAPDPTLCTDPDTERFFVFDLGYLRSSDYKFTLNSYINEQCEIEAASA
jgi:hypothetical protein